MRRKFSFSAHAACKWLAAALVGAAVACAAGPVPVVRYIFNEASGPALDTGSAPATNGVLNGLATRTNNTPNGAGSALNLNFPGATNYLSCGNPAKLNNFTNFTLTTWVNLQANPVAQERLLDKLATTGGFGWKISSSVASSVQLALHVNSNSGQATSAANVNASNQWVFLAVTYDGTSSSSNVRFYSGTALAPVAQLGSALNFAAGPVIDTSNELRVGSTPATANDRTPPGWFDDVRVYNTVLSLAELETARSENLFGLPSIVQQPEDQRAAPGSDAVFAVVAGGAGISYQWYFGSQPVVGGTAAQLTLTNISPAQAGGYFVVLTNPAGSLTSSVATLTVASQPLYGPGNNVPESAGWTLLYSLLLSNTAAYNTGGVPYTLDHHAWVTQFNRVAYYLEVQPTNGPFQFVWTAMDAFTSDPAQLGVPAYGSGAVFQQPVSHMDVRSSVPSVPNGTNLNGGAIKFIPGDDTTPAGNGRGAMQVRLNGQVLFAFNGWGGGGPSDLGIGNNPSGTNADWSHAANAGTYAVKRLLVYTLPRPQSAPVDADIVVYGGSSGGVIAAVQAARLGKRAVLLAQDNHLGGLSSGGLGWTDIGSRGSAYIGGLALEFYQRNGARYGQSVHFNLEPHLAEQIYGEMLAEAGVRVVFNQRVSSAVTNGLRLTQLTMEDGSAYTGKMFIDTTYEGDLLPLAGVSFAVGREGTNAYAESSAGVQTPGNGGVNYDPYVVPGNPASGLLPLVLPVTPGPRGSADPGVQAYNYRMCFTKTANNFLPMTPPAGYHLAEFELLGRYIEALVAKNGSISLGQFMTVDRPPAANKYDINNNGQLSTDLVGESLTWPTNTSAGRDSLRRRHENYMRGFFTFLATNPRVPANVRAEMQSWGMCQDEFLDTGGWPHAIYVREARRLVSDYVMTQQDCQGARLAADSIGLAAYQMDSHLIWRLPQSGYAMTEGGMFNTVPAPFPISYRSLIPRVGQCENLLCTFALSASHVAFASCRMEPVFMIVSQSAATAAAFALDDQAPVQQVNYSKLALQLQVDGQQLGSAASFGGAGIIVDDADPTGVSVVGDWTSSSATTGYWGVDYLHDGNTNKGASSITFTPALPSNGVYQVSVRWTANPNRSTAVPIEVRHPAGTNTFSVDQQANGGAWVPLLTTNFNAGSQAQVVVRNAGTTGYVIADAVQFLPQGAPASSVQVVASIGTASTAGGLPGRITFVRGGDTETALTVRYTLAGTASNGVDYVALPGSVDFLPGIAITNVTVLPRQNPNSTGAATVVILTLQAGGDYSVGPLNSAAVTVLQPAAPQRPTMLLPVPATNGWRLSCLGSPGASYQFQRATHLTNTWSVLSTVSADSNGLAECLDASPPSTQSFYRVQSQSPAVNATRSPTNP